MWRVFFALIGIGALLCLIPVRCALYLRWETEFFGVLCLYLGGFCVYARTIRFYRRTAGEYVLRFYDKNETLKNTLTLWPPPKKKKYMRRLLEKQEIGNILYILFSRHHFRLLHADLSLGGTNAARLAQSYGMLCGILTPIQKWLIQKDVPATLDLQVDFSSDRTAVGVSCMVCDPVGKLIVSALHAIKRRNAGAKENRKESQSHGKTSNRKYHAGNA